MFRIAAVVVMVAVVFCRTLLALIAESHRVKIGAPEPPSARVTTVSQGVIEPTLTYSSVVKELRRADLSFRVSGTVAHIHQVTGADGVIRDIHEGDIIPKGTILARLDTADYQRELELAAGKLATAEAKLKQTEADNSLAKVELIRTESLSRQRAAAVAELDAAKSRVIVTSAAVTGAQSEVASARVSLSQAQANLDYCSLSVPFDHATIGLRGIRNYEKVSANQPAFTLLDLSSVVIAFAVPDSLVGQLALGQELTITVEALPGRRFVGVIHKIASAADPLTRTYAVELRVDAPAGLRPGMIASVQLRAERFAYMLPLTAIAAGDEAGSTAVFRVDRSGSQPVVCRVPIEIEDIFNDRVIVGLSDQSALKPGDIVVISGVHRLYDGSGIKIVD
jgi:RND family efflux transporter MFP subunit